MLHLFINNIPVTAPINSTVMEACESVGISLPRFCYHPNLNVAGNCRMCLVEVEKVPKPIAACAYPVSTNMKIFTNSPLVEKARENVLEFLLINHPLDCPICDQAGECDLQEQVMHFGKDKSRFTFFKRSVDDINCGPLIKLIMTRCIHCTRCVRFLEHIGGEEELGMLGRGTASEINLFINQNLKSELSGNIIDLCPVGALTSKVYSFAARPWETHSINTIDITDGSGTPVKIVMRNTDLLKILPTTRGEDHWITNKTRFLIDGFKINRVTVPKMLLNGELHDVRWRNIFYIFQHVFKKLKPASKISTVILIGNNASLESIIFLKKISYLFNFTLISENAVQKKSNNFIIMQNNIEPNGLLNTDTILLLGANPRIESNLLNLKLKNLIIRNNVSVASVGNAGNLLYSYLILGNSLISFYTLIEGKHLFCPSIASAKKPMLLCGSNFEQRVDFAFIQYLITKIVYLSSLITSSKISYSYITNFINTTGQSFLMPSTTLIDFKSIKTIFAFDVDNIENFLAKTTATARVFLGTPIFNFSNIQKQKIKILLPVPTAFETTEHTMTFNGSIKNYKNILKTNIAPISKFLSILLSLLNLDIENLAQKTKFSFAATSILTYTNILLKTSNKLKSIKFKLFKKNIKYSLNNFYQTTLLSKNSAVLSLCQREERNLYQNFI